MTMVMDYGHMGLSCHGSSKLQSSKPSVSRFLMKSSERARRLVITKKGKPVAEVTPHKPAKRSPLGIWKGRTEILGDIISPIDVEWEALK